MKKRFLVILLVLLSFSVFAKEKGDALLNFLDSLYNKKIDYTNDSFKKQGFITTSALECGFETIWNNQIVSIFLCEEDKYSSFFFSQNPPVAITVGDPTPTNKITPDRYKYLSDWQKFINYFLDNYKLISSKNNVYRFKNFKIVNIPDDCSFLIMDYALDN